MPNISFADQVLGFTGLIFLHAQIHTVHAPLAVDHTPRSSQHPKTLSLPHPPGVYPASQPRDVPSPNSLAVPNPTLLATGGTS